MRLFTPLFSILSIVVVTVQAGYVNDRSSARHARVARRIEERLIDTNASVPRVRSRRSCAANYKNNNKMNDKTSQAVQTSSSSSDTAWSPAPTTWTPAPTTTDSPAPQPSSPDSGPSWSSGAGLIKVADAGECGKIGATNHITAVSGPNGHIDWLNCGIGSGGWSPPFISVSDIVTVELASVAYNPNSAFQPCTAFISIFEQYGQKYGIPAILLAAFAMQESGCNPSTVGGAGEQGLMQLTAEKCTNAPEGDCKDPDYNIHTGAKFFSDTLDRNDGNLLLSIGQYNGWFSGLTYDDATYAQTHGNCRAQNNLDYLHQFLNGWCQDINAYNYNPPLGQYFNLKVCASN